MRKISILVILCSSFLCCSEDTNVSPVNIVETNKLTDNLLHNAFTDLIFFDNQFFLVYRESDMHVTGRDGVIKIFSSIDSKKWDLIKTISVSGIDLRDPKFSNNNGKLMLYIHGSHFKNSNFIGRYDYKLDYNNGEWSNIKDVFLDNLKKSSFPYKVKGNEAWPWRITWYGGRAFTVAYDNYDIFDLYYSDDGIFFSAMNAFAKREGIPGEATIRFSSNQEMFVLYRAPKGNSFIGKSSNYSKEWDWFKEIPIINFGGPNFIFYNDSKLLISGRESDLLILSVLDIETLEYKKILTLESGGDCGYAGMIIKDDFLYMSYYSSHATPGGSSIYLAKIDIKRLLL